MFCVLLVFLTVSWILHNWCPCLWVHAEAETAVPKVTGCQWLGTVSQVMETSGAAVCWLSAVCLLKPFCPAHLGPLQPLCPPTSSFTVSEPAWGTHGEILGKGSVRFFSRGRMTRRGETRAQNGLGMSNGLFTPKLMWSEKNYPDISRGLFLNLMVCNWIYNHSYIYNIIPWDNVILCYIFI